jgi:hypothetical protein
MAYKHNTIEGIRKYCSRKDWDGYDAEPISEEVLKRAEEIRCVLPEKYEMFPCGDNSIQFEKDYDETDCWEIIEVNSNDISYSILYKNINNDSILTFDTSAEFIKFWKENQVNIKLEEIKKDF